MHNKLSQAFILSLVFISSDTLSMDRRKKQPEDHSFLWHAANTPMIPAAFTVSSFIADSYNQKDIAALCGVAAIVTALALPDSNRDNK